MWEWFSQDWWRLVWVPVFGLGSTWLANRFKVQTEARGGRDARLDARQDRMLEQADAEIEDLVRERDKAKEMADFWERNARWWFDRAHVLVHAVLSARTFGSLAMMRAGQKPPENWDKPVWLPALREPWAQKEPAPPLPDAAAGD